MNKIKILFLASILTSACETKPFWPFGGEVIKFNLAECEACRSKLDFLESAETLNAKMPLEKIMVQLRLMQVDSDMEYCAEHRCNPEKDKPTFNEYKKACKCWLENNEDFRKHILSEVEKGTEFLDRFEPLKAAVREHLNGN